MPREKPDCQRCGVCCVSPHEQDSFCDVNDADIRRMGIRLARANVLVHSVFDQALSMIDGRSLPPGAIMTQWRRQRAGPFKGIDVCACVFLRGSLMNQVSCRIYDRRPRACHEAVKPGDRSCRELRRMFRDYLRDS